MTDKIKEIEDAISILEQKFKFCDECQNENPPKKCSQCKKALYCDQKCQIKNWKRVHRKECKSITCGEWVQSKFAMDLDFKGNEATEWGELQESLAVQSYIKHLYKNVNKKYKIQKQKGFLIKNGISYFQFKHQLIPLEDPTKEKIDVKITKK